MNTKIEQWTFWKFWRESILHKTKWKQYTTEQLQKVGDNQVEVNFKSEEKTFTNKQNKEIT